MVFLGILISFSLSISISYAQELKITLDKDIITPGDSLKFSAGFNTQKPATLLLILANKVGKTWERRYPLIGYDFTAAIDIPPDMPQGNYLVQFVVLQNFFTFSGKVLASGKIKYLHSTLVTKGGNFYEKDISVLPDSSFAFTNVLFENDAILSFTNDKTNSEDLNLSVQHVQDSLLTNINPVQKNIFIGTEAAAETGKQTIPSSSFSNPGEAYMLDVVVVEAKARSNADKFNDAYSTGLFRDGNERILDFTNVNSGYGSVMQYLQGRVAGLGIYYNGLGARAIWRNQPVSFYIDEIRSDISFVQTIPINDIAIVKVYPPPFFGNFGGSGGAIAIYTKRGDNYKNLGRTTFQVTGYIPLSSQLKVFE